MHKIDYRYCNTRRHDCPDSRLVDFRLLTRQDMSSTVFVRKDHIDPRKDHSRFCSTTAESALSSRQDYNSQSGNYRSVFRRTFLDTPINVVSVIVLIVISHIYLYYEYSVTLENEVEFARDKHLFCRHVCM